MQAEQCNAAQSRAKRSKTPTAASDMIQSHNSHCCATCKPVKPVKASAAHSLQLAKVRSRCEVVSFRWSLCCRAVRVQYALLPICWSRGNLPHACRVGSLLGGTSHRLVYSTDVAGVARNALKLRILQVAADFQPQQSGSSNVGATCLSV
jgi:hypothetical protein